ncbi:MAG: hypothetical protein UR58_C0001G0743 [Candidatus Campbellbacteria bacterium GW2011_OD1_34_28]|nr:MAG: hypothetical protein UR58_C0001G0743 [Candidatus Campbellbacteria bacterium GW2011_OD1_34_28]
MIFVNNCVCGAESYFMKNSKIFIIFFIVFFFGLGSGFSILGDKLSSNNLEIDKIEEKVFLVFDGFKIKVLEISSRVHGETEQFAVNEYKTISGFFGEVKKIVYSLQLTANSINEDEQPSVVRPVAVFANAVKQSTFVSSSLQKSVNNLALAVYETANPVEQFAVVWYRTINSVFASVAKQSMNDVDLPAGEAGRFTIVREDEVSQSETSSDSSVFASDSEADRDEISENVPSVPATPKTTTIVTNPIREIIKETVVERVIQTSGVTLEDLQKLNNELRSEIYKLSSNTNTQITNTYQVISATNNIDNLGSVTITDSNISSSNVSGTELSFTNGTIQNLTVTGTATSTYGGPISATNGTYSGNLTVTGNTTLNTLTVSGDTIFDTDTLYIDSINNRVGIGSTTPSDTLSINGATYLAPISAPSITTDRLYNISNDLYWGGNLLSGSAVGNWTSNGTDVWRASGNVGIGTSSPSSDYRLSVQGNTYIKGNLRVNGNTTISDSGELTVGDKVISEGEIGVGTSSPYAKLSIQGTTVSTTTFGIYGFANQTQSLFDVYDNPTNNLNVFRITSDGNVGIATSSPFRKLSVEGSAWISGDLTANSFTATSSMSAPYFTATDSSATSTFAGGLAVGTNNLVVDRSTGNVGIGTSNPSTKLDVNGSITTNSSFSLGQNLGSMSMSSAVGGLLISSGINQYIRLQVDSGGTSNHLGINLGSTPYSGFTFMRNSDGNIFLGMRGPSSENPGSNTYQSKLTASDTGLTLTTATGDILLNPNSFVGINTLTPTKILSLNDSTSNPQGSVVLRISGNDNGDSGTLDYGLSRGIDFYNGSDTGGRSAIFSNFNSALSNNSSLSFWTSQHGGTFAERMRINGIGNVGIGTIAPGSKLDIQVVGDGVAARIGNTSGRYLSIGAQTTPVGAWLGYGDDHDVTILASGNIGIGTTSPFAKLSVTGTGTGTGLAFQVADSANSPKFTILDNGNVGIGTTSPGYALDISNAGATGLNIMRGGGSSANSTIRVANYTNAMFLGINSNEDFAVGTSADLDSTAKFVVMNGGNVGIGTTNPGAMLELSSISINGSVLRLSNNNNTIAQGEELGSIEFFSGDNSGSYPDTVKAKILSLTEDSVSRDGNLVFKTSLLSDASPVERMRINSNGNVGIGSTSPTDMLTISSAGNTDLGIYNTNWSTGNEAVLRFGHGDGTGDGNGNGAQSEIRSYLPGAGDSDLRFYTTDSTTVGSNPSMVITGNGNIGIGTTSPFAKLSVTGAGTGTGLAFQVADSANSPKFTILDNGNVGIGTVSPSSLLQINIPYAKTDTAERNIAAFLSTDAGVGGSGLVMTLTGAPGQAARAVGLQTEIANSDGTLNVADGILRLQPHGGDVNIGASTDGYSTLLRLDDQNLTYSNLPSAVNQAIITTNAQGVDIGASLGLGGRTDDAAANGRIFGVITGRKETATTNVQSGYLSFATNLTGTVSEKMRITSGGNVGIGTTSPFAKLSIHAKNGETNTTLFNIASSTASATTSLFTVLNNGNVGIGTVSPTKLLTINDVTSNPNNSIALRISNSDITDSGGSTYSLSAGIDFYNNDDTRTRSAIFSNFNQAFTYDSALSFWTSQHGGTFAERMRILGNGNIGIGTTTPGAKLDVYASYSEHDGIRVDGDRPLYLKSDGLIEWSGGAGGWINSFQYKGNAATNLIQQGVYGSSDSLNYYYVGSAYNDTAFRVYGNKNATFGGNVGIGTTGPSQKLQVTGNILSEDTSANGKVLVGAVSNYPGIWFAANTTAPSTSNYAFLYDSNEGKGTTLNTPSTMAIGFRVNNFDKMRLSPLGGLALGSTYSSSNTQIEPGSGNMIIEGNVGIGTTNPGAKLDIVSSGTGFVAALSLRNLNTYNDNTGMSFYGVNSVSTVYEKGRISVGIGSGNSNSGMVSFSAANDSATVLEIMRINGTTGNVGIGTTSPFAKLSVKGAGTTTGVNFQTTNSADTPLVTVLDSGNVGIGTVSPTHTLDVNTSSVVGMMFAGGVNHYAVGMGAVSGGAFIQGYSDILGSSGKVLSIQAGSGNLLIGSYTDVVGGAKLQVTGSTTITGNVGIGTTSPDAVLNVIGNSTTMGGIHVTAQNITDAPWISFGVNGLGTAYDNFGSITNSNGFRFRSSANVSMVPGASSAFSVFSASDVVNPKFTVVSGTGNVGIGTTSPFAKLSVKGAGTTTGINFQTTNSADTPLVTVLDSGNVGIGITAPVTELQVVQKTDGPNFGSGAPTTGLRVSGYDDKSASYGNISIDQNGHTIFSSSGSMYFSAGNTLSAYFSTTIGLGLGSDKQLGFGAATDDMARMEWDTAQTNDALIIGLNDDGGSGNHQSRSLIIADVNDMSFNFQHSEQSNPTMFIHSAAQSTNQWLSLTHNGTNGVFGIGTGSYIFNDGNIGIGTTTPWRTLSVNGTAAFTGLTNNGTGYYACVSTNGELATSTTACGASSERFKTNINDLTYGLDTVLQLRPVSFNWKSDFINSSSTQIGFIAEEVDLLIPEVIGHDDKGNIMNLDYPKLTSVLVNAVKEIWQRVVENTSNILANKNEIAELKERVAKLEALLVNQTASITEITQSTTTPPLITIIGNNPATVELNTNYSDLGATAVNGVGDSLIVDVFGEEDVDTSIAGEYTVTYTAFDGTLTSTSTRTVLVEEPTAVTTEPATTIDPVVEPTATTTEPTTTETIVDSL